MIVTTNTTDRKALAKALAEHLGTTSKYMGMPSCGYQVGNYIINKEGNITGEDFEAIRDFLREYDCLPEEDNTTEPEEQHEPEEEGPWDAEDQLCPGGVVRELYLVFFQFPDGGFDSKPDVAVGDDGCVLLHVLILLISKLGQFKVRVANHKWDTNLTSLNEMFGGGCR